MKNFQFNVIFKEEPDGFTAIVPSLPGCISGGKTLAKAKLMIKDAIELYISVMTEDGEKIIDDSMSNFMTSINVRSPIKA